MMQFVEHLTDLISVKELAEVDRGDVEADVEADCRAVISYAPDVKRRMDALSESQGEDASVLFMAYMMALSDIEGVIRKRQPPATSRARLGTLYVILRRRCRIAHDRELEPFAFAFEESVFGAEPGDFGFKVRDVAGGWRWHA